MRGELLTYDGKRYRLPDPLAFRFEYGCGVPCDSFWLELPLKPGEGEVYGRGVRLEAYEGVERVFTGVVDEAEWGQSGAGSRATLSGRSMAALLLDNEAQAVDYAAATQGDVIADHVAPYGIQVVGAGHIPACPGFSVASGQSEWQVVYNFARYHGGIPPRFDREGRLVLAPFSDGSVKVLGEEIPVTAISATEKRYGVLSQVLVTDRRRQRVETVDNREFLAQGGSARRVISATGGRDARALRYSGQFQLEKSKAGRRTVTLTVPRLFFAWPGELLQLERRDWTGRWRVLESTVASGEQGGSTTLKLGAVNAVI